MPMIRRFQWDSTTAQMVERAMDPAEYHIVQDLFGRTSAAVRRELCHPVISGIDFSISDEQHPRLVRPVPHSERVRLEALLALFAWFDACIANENPSGPGAVADAENLETTLVDLARAGKKDDFYFLARASAGIPHDKCDEVWTGARRRLRLVP